MPHMGLSTEHLDVAGLRSVLDTLAPAIESHPVDQPVTVAVVSDPFGGREAVIDALASRLDGPTERIQYESTVDPEDVPDPATVDTLVIEDAHYLYSRRIGGFEALREFIEGLVGSDTHVVTSWNRHSWHYLREIRGVDDLIDHCVMIPSLGVPELRDFLTARFGPDLPEFVDRGSAGRVKTFAVESAPISLPVGGTLEVPRPSVNPAWIASWSAPDEDRSIERVVYEKIARVAEGNPGVAEAIWERGVRDGELAPGDIEDPAVDSTLDDDAVFLLWNLAAFESLGRESLHEVVGTGQLDARIHELAARDLISVDGDRASLVPHALPATVSVLEREGLLW